MTQPIQTLIVVPCYNEADRIDLKAFQTFVGNNPNITLLFVNDGSTDDTKSKIEQLASASAGKILTLALVKNSGKAEAVRQGFLKGLALNPQFIGFLDADLAAPLDVIKELEAILIATNKNVAIGARVALLGRRIERKRMRHYAGRLFATVASMILSLPIYDTQCGAKLFRVNDQLKQVFSFPFSVKWIFDVEILARFIMIEKTEKGIVPLIDTCVEHPLQVWEDKKGSKIKPKDFIISGLDMLKIFTILHIYGPKHPYRENLKNIARTSTL